MSIILDPKKQLINIDIFFIEHTRVHGNSTFSFIKSAADMAAWKEKGYKTEDEIVALSKQEQPKALPPGAAIPQQQQGPLFDPAKIISKIITTWRRITWKDQNHILSSSLKTITSADGKTSTELDGIKYRDTKLKTCLKNWSIKDAEGNEVPVTQDAIDSLSPEVAGELLNAFEQVTEPTPDDLKN